MDILQTGQRVTLPDPRVTLYLSGAAARWLPMWVGAGNVPVRAELFGDAV